MKNHWLETDLVSLDQISSFEEMVPIALEILTRMNRIGQPVHQLCGPMSTGGRGSLEKNMDYFHRAIELANQKGWLVFDQTPFQDAMTRLAADSILKKEYCLDILHVFYRGVFKSGLVHTLVFLPDWESSFGARWEWKEAKELKVEVKHYPEEWLLLLE